LPRLSGRSMNTARSLGTGDESIQVPTARTASRSAATSPPASTPPAAP
jgi:hypothetical protein